MNTRNQWIKLDHQDFLKNYWQKKPLVLKNVLKDYDFPLTEDELAGLACEEEFFSRRMWQSEGKHHCETGPFESSDFNKYSGSKFTFLVYGVDKFFENIRDLKNYFRFIPDWRFDDISISYAEAGASVGAHHDRYDVFIVQGPGKRKWKLEESKRSSYEEKDHVSGLNLLDNFKPSMEVELEQGDVLYIPPLWGHHGISIDKSISYSVGFRASSYKDIFRSLSETAAVKMNDDLFKDSFLELGESSAEIKIEVIKNLVMPEGFEVKDSKLCLTAFGKHLSQVDSFPISKPETLDFEKVYLKDLDAKTYFSVFSDEVLMFANGEVLSFKSSDLDFVRTVCESYELKISDFKKYKEALEKLIAIGVLFSDL